MALLRRIRTVFTGVAGTPWYSNQYIQDDDSPVTDTLLLWDQFWSQCGFAMHADVNWTVEGDVAIIDSATGQTVATKSGTPQTGAGVATDDPLPFAMQGLIRLRTNVYVGGREIRGKIFVPGITEAGSIDGRPDSSTITQLQTAATELQGDLNTNWFVYSPTKHQAAEVAVISVWNQFAVLRSRRD